MSDARNFGGGKLLRHKFEEQLVGFARYAILELRANSYGSTREYFDGREIGSWVWRF